LYLNGFTGAVAVLYWHFFTGSFLWALFYGLFFMGSAALAHLHALFCAGSFLALFWHFSGTLTAF